MIKKFDNIRTKQMACAFRYYIPTFLKLLRICPHQIFHYSIKQNLVEYIYFSYLVKSICTWRYSSINTKYLIIYQRRKWKIVNKISKNLPDSISSILFLPLIVEFVGLSELSRFVISTQKRDSFLLSRFESSKQCKRFNRLAALVRLLIPLFT